MRRLFAFLIAFAFVSVSLTSPSMASPANAPAHQAHCADMPMGPADHQKAPAKPTDVKKCCFSALPAISMPAPIGAGEHMTLPRPAIARLDVAALVGMSWTADPPPPRNG